MPAQRPAGLAWIALGLLLALDPARADVIHLINGGSIVADSWEESGDDLIIRHEGGTLIIPRADVSRIETSRSAAGNGSPRETGDGADEALQRNGGSSVVKPDTAIAPSREEALERIADLKRRIRDYPLARDANRAQLLALLNYLGERSYLKRDYDDALMRFREALEQDPDNARAHLGQAATYFATGQDLYARSILERALLKHPEDPRLLTLLGDVYNSQERPEDALQVWEKAQALSPDEAILRRIDTLRRQQAVQRDYRRSDAPHFTLKYDGERAGPDLEAEILDFLEARFPDLVTRFDFYPSQPIVVIVYPARQFYEATLAERNVAGLFDGKIRVPSGGLESLTEDARQVLLHELAHAFIAGKSRRTAPRWLHEGIAQFIEGKSTPASVEADLALRYGRMDDREGWGREFSYPSSLSFIEFLVDREGFYRLVEILEAMAAGASDEAAFLDVTRYGLQELREAWGEALLQAHEP